MRNTAELMRKLRAKEDEELLAPLRALGIEPSGNPSITWVGDLQQGDGGKGAMTDRLAASHDIIVRTQGGDNAGHTSVFYDADGNQVILKNHLTPSGLRHSGTVGVIANGVLVNAETLVREAEELKTLNFDAEQRLLVSSRAHLVLPMHMEADSRQEDRRSASSSVIGTTKRGIGPANVSKVNRTGVRVGDLADMEKVEMLLQQNADLFALPHASVVESMEWLLRYRDSLLNYSVDSVKFLNAAISAGYSVLFEGAQGPLIDIDHGIYPYVTTSPTAFHSVASGAGVDASKVNHRIGVLKTYQTMVGNGAFVTEDSGDLGERLRTLGHESGTTTGRPRRCGWLDLAHARWAVGVNGYTSIVLTKLDILDGFDEIGLCVGYRRGGEEYLGFEPENDYLLECEPIYEFLPGWQESTSGCSSYEELPANARRLFSYISNHLGVPVSGVSKGPADSDLIITPGTELEKLMPTASGCEKDARRILVFCGASTGNRNSYTKIARELGEACSTRGIGVVYGAGGVGVMGALSDAVLESGGDIIGVIPQSLMDREFGRRDLPDLRVVSSMHERKAIMTDLAQGIIALPGGLGTLEELFEALTWRQLEIHEKPVVLLDQDGFFDPLISVMDHLAEQGFISSQDRALIRRATTVDEALALISA
ncbi:adenylosuccinate synthase [Streptomyces sp. NPDC004787]|uniref:adenylosuccinate synthase n=1 Tax=Streptomyces sp. NPDC004787 TaxID=3154291 RepID=UPI0033B39C18